MKHTNQVTPNISGFIMQFQGRYQSSFEVIVSPVPSQDKPVILKMRRGLLKSRIKWRFC